MEALLQKARRRAVPSSIMLLFENQMALAEGGRRVIKVPTGVKYESLHPTRWGYLCPPMAALDEALTKQREAHTADGYCYYDGFDVFATEGEARDTRFQDSLVKVPNPVYDANMCTEVFSHREVFRRGTASDTIITAEGDGGFEPGPESRLDTSAGKARAKIGAELGGDLGAELGADFDGALSADLGADPGAERSAERSAGSRSSAEPSAARSMGDYPGV
jgi:hypothetical protein